MGFYSCAAIRSLHWRESTRDQLRPNHKGHVPSADDLCDLWVLRVDGSVYRPIHYPSGSLSNMRLDSAVAARPAASPEPCDSGQGQWRALELRDHVQGRRPPSGRVSLSAAYEFKTDKARLAPAAPELDGWCRSLVSIF